MIYPPADHNLLGVSQPQYTATRGVSKAGEPRKRQNQSAEKNMPDGRSVNQMGRGRILKESVRATMLRIVHSAFTAGGRKVAERAEPPGTHSMDR